MTQVQYIDAINLKRVAHDSVINKRNRSIKLTTISAIIKAHDNINTKFPILFSMIHNDKELRMEISTGIKDMPSMWIDCDVKFQKFIKSTEV